MSEKRKRHEELRNESGTSIIMPDAGVMDLPHVPAVWGAFDEDLFWLNRDKLLGLQNRALLSNTQEKTIQSLSYAALAPFMSVLRNTNQWTEVRQNIAQQLGEGAQSNFLDIVPFEEFQELFDRQLNSSHGDIIVMGTSHSMVYPIHDVVRRRSIGQDMRIAEIVIDKHIDTTVNVPYVTSANVYWHLVDSGLLFAPIFLGVKKSTTETFIKQGEHKKIRRILATTDEDMKSSHVEDVISQVVDVLRKWSITHVTFSVDLDALSINEGGMNVRYSPVLSYLGLGCQSIPDNPLPEDLKALKYLRYPSSRIRQLLREDTITLAQNPLFSRFAEVAQAPSESALLFSEESMSTDIGDAMGLSLNQAKRIIRLTKQALIRANIQYGVPINTGARYTGSVVEMCGFETIDRRTSKAAIDIARALRE